MKTMLKELRKNAGLSQEEMAKKLSIKVSRFGTWERGERMMSLQQACDICDILGCTLDELAGREVVRRTNDIQEDALLRKWRNMDAQQKSMVMASVNAAQPKKVQDHPRGLSEGIA